MDDIPLLKCYRNTGFNKHSILLIPFWRQKQFRLLSKHMKHILLFTVVLLNEQSRCLCCFIVTGFSFGQNCTVSEACLTFLSTCINERCGCSTDRQYVPKTDACILGKYQVRNYETFFLFHLTEYDFLLLRTYVLSAARINISS